MLIPNNNGLGNRYYIDGKQTPSLILVRGNTYNFKFSSGIPESSATGYSGNDQFHFIFQQVLLGHQVHTQENTLEE